MKQTTRTRKGETRRTRRGETRRTRRGETSRTRRGDTRRTRTRETWRTRRGGRASPGKAEEQTRGRRRRWLLCEEETGAGKPSGQGQEVGGEEEGGDQPTGIHWIFHPSAFMTTISLPNGKKCQWAKRFKYIFFCLS